jgi:hypothetical protein
MICCVARLSLPRHTPKRRPDSYGGSVVKGKIRRCVNCSRKIRRCVDCQQPDSHAKAVPLCSGQPWPANSYPEEHAAPHHDALFARGQLGNQGGRTNLDGGILQPKSGTASCPPWTVSGVSTDHLSPGSSCLSCLAPICWLTSRPGGHLRESRRPRRSAIAPPAACGRGRWP